MPNLFKHFRIGKYVRGKIKYVMLHSSIVHLYCFFKLVPLFCFFFYFFFVFVLFFFSCLSDCFYFSRFLPFVPSQSEGNNIVSNQIVGWKEKKYPRIRKRLSMIFLIFLHYYVAISDYFELSLPPLWFNTIITEVCDITHQFE